MKKIIGGTLVLLLCQAVQAQSPASAFDRGSSLQGWQDPRHAEVVAQCSEPPPPFGFPAAEPNDQEPPAPALPKVAAIPGIVAGDAEWQVVWAWQGNNADGPIALDDGRVLFANNDASNAIALDPDTGLAEILYADLNTAGALSRSKTGELFLAMRGLGSGVLQLEPERRVFADTINGEPFDCVGGVVNDISADSKGGVYISVTGSGVFYADPDGNITEYGEGVGGANGIILSPDESVLYVTNGPELLAFDVAPDGALSNQRVFGQLSGGGDGSAVDEQGRVFVATGAAADVFSAEGEKLGSIPGPRGMHGVFFGGPDKSTLFGIVFYGTWGTGSARNQIVALPTLTQGYSGRAK